MSKNNSKGFHGILKFLFFGLLKRTLGLIIRLRPHVVVLTTIW